MLEFVGDSNRLWSKEKTNLFEALYKGQKMSGAYPAQTLKENVVH